MRQLCDHVTISSDCEMTQQPGQTGIGPRLGFRRFPLAEAAEEPRRAALRVSMLMARLRIDINDISVNKLRRGRGSELRRTTDSFIAPIRSSTN